jgi:hypothetical protein
VCIEFFCPELCCERMEEITLHKIPLAMSSVLPILH